MMTSNVVDKQKRFENATCGRGFFSKTGEKTSVFKVSGYVWTGPNTERACYLFQKKRYLIKSMSKRVLARHNASRKGVLASFSEDIFLKV